MDKSTLETSLIELETVMASAISVNEKLLAATRSERQALRSLDHASLREIIDLKIALASQAIRLEQRRERAAAAVARHVDAGPRATLAELVWDLPGEWRDRLGRFSGRLIRALRELSEATAHNAFITRNGIYLTSNLIAALAPAASPGNAYSGSGRGISGESGSIVEFTG